MQGHTYNQTLKHCSCEVSFAFCWYALRNKLYKNTCYSFSENPHSKVKRGRCILHLQHNHLENLKNKLVNNNDVE